MIDSILPFVLSHAVLFYGLCYTDPQSRQRPLLAAVIVTFCVVSARSTVAQAVPGLVGGEYSIGFAFHASHYLLLARLSPLFPSSASPAGRRAWSFDQIFTARWGVAYIPPWDRKRPYYVPTRSTFLASRSWDLLWTAGLICLLRTFTLNVELEDFVDIPDGFLHRIMDVTPREAVIRLYITVGGLIEVYSALRGLYSLSSIIGVSIFGDAPARWPPLFGRLKDAYSLRRYYSHFWHHLMRKAFTAHARVLAARLGFRQRGPTTRYAIIVLTFLCSAVLHVASAPVPLRCGVTPQLQFYATVVAAIAVEDLVIRTARPLMDSRAAANDGAGKDLRPAITTPRTCEKQPTRAAEGVSSEDEDETPALSIRIVGYLWVMSFFVWAASRLIYRTQSCLVRPSDWGMPLSSWSSVDGNATSVGVARAVLG